MLSGGAGDVRFVGADADLIQDFVLDEGYIDVEDFLADAWRFPDQPASDSSSLTE